MNRGMNTSQIVSQGLLTENHVRILSYWSQRKSVEDTAAVFQQLRQQKVQQIHQMKELLTNSLCMRQQMLEIFGQELVSKPENCCSKCGVDISQIIESQNERSTHIMLHTWDERLSLLFPSIN